MTEISANRLFSKYHSPGCCPSKLLLKHSFNFSWGDYKSQEKWKTMLMQNFGGTTNSINAFLKKAFKHLFSTCCNWVTLPCCDSMIFLSASTAACIRSTAVQYRKWSPTANDPETENDPQNGPQMILDRKWSPKSTANDPVKNWGMEWILGDRLQKRADY